ncbi:unnamed protein product [Lymnaea stagnalis]|uniref:AIG1-type G domain-containing protein n=1 Tax=Lymnaea stagnalis TaxID=6523 RepID=A0AAV2H9Q3_LYMST
MKMSRSKPTFNLMLLGKTGVGKSATGNTLVNRKHAFKPSNQMLSCTKEPQLECGEFGHYIIKVVDTPGLQDTNIDMDVTVGDVSNSMALLPDGFDAFLLVMRYGERCTKEVIEVISALRASFGEVFAKEYCIIVMTHGENFDMEDEEDQTKTFDDYCKDIEGPPELLSLLVDCEYRTVLFYNKSKARREESVNRLLELVQTMKHRSHRYNSEVFAKFASERDTYVISLKLPQLIAPIQEKLSFLKEYLEKAMEESNANTDLKVKERAQELLNTIEEESKGTSLMDGLKNEVKQIIKTLENLPSERQQRQNMLKKLNSLVETIKNPPSTTGIIAYGLLRRLYTATGCLCMVGAFVAPPLAIAGVASFVAAKKFDNDYSEAVTLYKEEERDYATALSEINKIKEMMGKRK